MKKYFAILLLPLLAACTKGPQEAIISGTLQNYKDTVAYLSSKGVIETIKVNADKTFEFKTIIDKPVLYTLKTGRRTNFELYVSPGEITQVNIDFENIKDGPKYSGTLEGVNNFLLEKEKIVNKYFTSFKVVYALESKKFNQKLDSLRNELAGSIKTITNKNIAGLEELRLDYFVRSLKASYPENNSYVLSKEFNADSADYSCLDGLDLNSANHLMFKEYLELVNTVIANKFRKEVGAKNLETMPAPERLAKLFALIDINVTNLEVRDYLKQTSFMDDLSYGEFWKLSDIVNKFLADCKVPGYKSIIEKLYSEKMAIAPGNVAPKFSYKDINGKEYSLESLKGKLVYIDFWATWCGPCRHELPYLEEVEKAYEGKKIIFISMSVDTDMVAWEKMVKEKKMKGLQLHADGDWSSIAAKAYQVKGIPTFVLIDQNGMIISPSAPRPSSGAELVNLLDENLAKIK